MSSGSLRTSPTLRPQNWRPSFADHCRWPRHGPCSTNRTSLKGGPRPHFLHRWVGGRFVDFCPKIRGIFVRISTGKHGPLTGWGKFPKCILRLNNLQKKRGSFGKESHKNDLSYLVEFLWSIIVQVGFSYNHSTQGTDHQKGLGQHVTLGSLWNVYHQKHLPLQADELSFLFECWGCFWLS